MNGRAGSFIGAVTDGWDLLELIDACVEFWPILLIVAGAYLLRFIFTGIGGGPS
jgi:hypothetical protein